MYDTSLSSVFILSDTVHVFLALKRALPSGKRCQNCQCVISVHFGRVHGRRHAPETERMQMMREVTHFVRSVDSVAQSQ